MSIVFRSHALSVVVAAMVVTLGLVTAVITPAPPAAAAATGLSLENLPFTGLAEPTSVEFAANGQVFVAERRGVIKVFNNLDSTNGVDVADLRTRVFYGGDRGLLSIALDPQYPARPYLWALYTKDADIGGTAPKFGTPGGDADACSNSAANDCRVSGELTRLTLNPATGKWTGAETVLLSAWCQQFGSHSIGSVTFGTDGFLYVSAGDGASYNTVDTGAAGNQRCSDPTSQGGALRAQSVRRPAGTAAVPNGAVLRLDPDTGNPAPGNPFAGDSDPIRQRVLAYGFRNPFRIAARPGTAEVWVGDVGWNDWEELDRVDVGSSKAQNFGWPCYEGPGRQGGYEAAQVPLCQSLYAAGTSAVVAPQLAYSHGSAVGAGCPAGSSSVSALAFSSPATSYPTEYGNGVFFGDYARHCLWYANLTGSSIDQASVRVIDTTAYPAELKNGPNGDVYLVDIAAGTIKRLRATATGNTAPLAVVRADKTSGPTPLTIQFDGSGSSDPDAGSSLTYAWDLDADGQFDDSTQVAPTWTYTAAGAVTVKLRVTDNLGTSTVGSLRVTSGSTAPMVQLNSAASTTPWKVGDQIRFTVSATDAEDGPLAPATITTKLVIKHCPGGANCHEHVLATYTGAGTSFTAPDHEYPSYLELQASATDSSGLTTTSTLRLDPATVTLKVDTVPSGLQAVVAGTTGTTPFTIPVIKNSLNTIAVPSQQQQGATYTFSSWSDGGAVSHDITATSSATFVASFTQTAGPPALAGLVGSYGFNEGGGATAGDASGQGNAGTLEGPTWTSAGKYGGALDFDGINDRVTVPDIPALDLTNQVTLTAWVRPTALHSWEQAVLKERPNGLSYALYAGGQSGSRPNATVSNGSTDGYVDGVADLSVATWTHLAMTYDGATLKLYVNGTLVASRAETRIMPTSTSPLRIGGNAVWGEWFAGRIDEVHVYNRALSAAEVTADQSGGGQDTVPPTTPTGLQATGEIDRVNLTWSASTDNAGPPTYEVHRSLVSGFNPDAATRIATGLTTPAYVDLGRPAGTYYYKVIASDGKNLSAASAQATATVTGDTTAPTVPGRVTATVAGTTATVSWSPATDNVAVADYQVLRDGPGGPTTFAVSAPTTNLADADLPAGTYTYRVRARDAAANASDYAAAVQAVIVVDAAPPTVTVTAPTTGKTVSETLTLTANAADDVGVAGVQFRVDSANVGAEDTSAPYSTSWSSGTVANGTHQITAVARDGSGRTTTSTSVIITVDNSATGPTGLVGGWSFDQGSGPTVTDVSGLGNTGTLVNGPKWTTAGKYGGAVTLDGVNDYITMPDAGSLDLTTGMTISAWVRPTALGSWSNVLMKETAQGLSYSLYATNASSNSSSRPNGTVRIGATDVTVPGSTSLTSGSWAHLALTYDGSRLLFYVNGKLVKTVLRTGSMTTSDAPLRIGGNSIWGEWFKGDIDEVRVYNRALSVEEIRVVRDTRL